MIRSNCFTMLTALLLYSKFQVSQRTKKSNFCRNYFKPDQTPVILLRLDNLVFSVAALTFEELFIIKMVSDIQLLTLCSLNIIGLVA
jgi:hypothetical protein